MLLRGGYPQLLRRIAVRQSPPHRSAAFLQLASFGTTNRNGVIQASRASPLSIATTLAATSRLHQSLASFSTTTPTSTTQTSTTTPFLLADIGEGIKEVELLQWFVQPQQHIAQFDKICEVQSDKATVEITSRYDGVVTELCGNVGDMMAVGSPLLYIETTNATTESSSESVAATSSATTTTTEERESTHVSLETGQKLEQPQQVVQAREAAQETRSSTTPAEETNDEKVPMSPAVRRLCKEYGISPSSIQGTGPQGRILKSDVLAMVDDQPPTATQQSTTTTTTIQPPPTTTSADTKDEILQLRGYTRLMAQTMTESLQIPHMALGEELDVTQLLQLRQKINANNTHTTTPKISFLALFLKACSVALHQHPLLNAAAIHSDNNEAAAVRLQPHHNLGVAMDTPRGLVVPVLRHVQDMSVVEIQAQLDRLKSLAHNLPAADLEVPPTFTISNVGALGAGLHLKPVLVPPQLAMGALGRVRRLPRFDTDDNNNNNNNNDQVKVVAADVLPVTWAGDHRYLDGAALARFHVTVARLLQDPVQMLIHLK